MIYTRYLLFCLFPILMHADTIELNDRDKPSELEIAPPIPLEPQFPLGLTQANRQFLIENPERLKELRRSIQQDLDKHTFPWLTMITLLGCGGIGWVVYLMRDRWPKRSLRVISPFSSQQQIEKNLQVLSQYHPEPNQIPAYYAQLTSLLLEAIQNQLGAKITGLTTPELTRFLKTQSDFSSQQITEVLSILTKIDHIKFAGEKPSREERMQIFQKVQIFILNNMAKKT